MSYSFVAPPRGELSLIHIFYYSGCIEMIDDENAVLINTGIYDEKMGLKIEESSDANFMI